MEEAFWLARIFGPFFTIVAIWMMTHQDMLMKIWYSAKTSPAILHMGGMINFLIGFTILSTYCSWSWSLAVLLPILGWLLVARGLVIFFATDWFINYTTKKEPFSKLWAIIPLIFGVGLSWFAFV